MKTKECIKCKLEKPRSEFYFRNKSRGWLMSVCKMCSHKQSAESHKRNPEKRLEIQRQYQQDHQEELREYWRQYRAENRERLRDLRRKRQQRNRDAVNTYNREWARNNPDKSKRIYDLANDKKSPYGLEIRKTIRAIEQLEELISNAEKQD